MLLRKRKQDNLTVIKSKKPILKQGIERFVAYYFKKIFTILAIAMIPFLIIGCIVIAILSAILWFLPNTETSNNIQTFFSNTLNVETVETTGGSNIVGGVIGWAIDSFCAILYLIFIKPIVWLLGGMQDVVYFIGGEALTNSNEIIKSYFKENYYQVANFIYQSNQETFDGYDYVLIDYPPTINDLSLSFLLISDLIVIPINSGSGSYKGIIDLKNTLELISKKENLELSNIKIVFNNVKTDKYIKFIYNLILKQGLKNNFSNIVL